MGSRYHLMGGCLARIWIFPLPDGPGCSYGWRIMRSIVLYSGLSLAMLLPACGPEKKPASLAGPPPAASAARPPAPADNAAPGVRLTLSGGGLDGDVNIAFDPASAKLEILDGGFRLSMEDPGHGNGSATPAWGFWLFADGPLAEEAVLRCRTGTQLTLDGKSYAPVAKAGQAPGPTSHPLDATVTIIVLDTRKNVFEGEIDGTFTAPDGKEPIKVAGTLLLPWPEAAAP